MQWEDSCKWEGMVLVHGGQKKVHYGDKARQLRGAHAKAFLQSGENLARPLGKLDSSQVTLRCHLKDSATGSGHRLNQCSKAEV